MKPCMEQWTSLVSSPGAADERARAQAFAECARSKRVIYSVVLRDPGTGKDVRVADLDKHAGPVEVRVTVENGGTQEVLVWDARSAHSVYPLLAE